MLNDFQNSFTGRLSGNLASKAYVNIPPENMNVRKLVKLKKCIVTNDKSQGSIAKHLSCYGLLHDKFVIQFAGERIFKIGEHSAKLQAMWLIVSYAPFALYFCPQKCQISKITCVLCGDKNC